MKNSKKNKKIKKKRKRKGDDIYDIWEGQKGSFQGGASFTMPSHTFLFTKLSLHYFIRIFILNKSLDNHF